MLKIKPIINNVSTRLGLTQRSLKYEITLFWFFVYVTPPVYFFNCDLYLTEIVPESRIE